MTKEYITKEYILGIQNPDLTEADLDGQARIDYLPQSLSVVELSHLLNKSAPVDGVFMQGDPLRHDYQVQLNKLAS